MTTPRDVTPVTLRDIRRSSSSFQFLVSAPWNDVPPMTLSDIRPSTRAQDGLRILQGVAPAAARPRMHLVSSLQTLECFTKCYNVTLLRALQV